MLILGANGEPLVIDGKLVMVYLEGIPNANAQVPLQAIIQEQCDLEHWHARNGVINLPCWGSD